jgi:hypothetical protein
VVDVGDDRDIADVVTPVRRCLCHVSVIKAGLEIVKPDSLVLSGSEKETIRHSAKLVIASASRNPGM